MPNEYQKIIVNMEKMGFEDSHDVSHISERLKRREKERQQLVVKRKEEREQSSASVEQVSYFLETFATKQREIEDILEKAASGNADRSELTHIFETANKDLQTLQHFVSTSTHFLRVYDIRKAQEAIQILQQKMQELEEKLLPKKKFGFKVRKSSTHEKGSFNQKIEDTVDSSNSPGKLPLSKVLSGLSDNICGYSSRVGETLSLSHDVIFKKDVVLSGLEGCTVELTGAPSTLHMSTLRNCRIMSGPVATSIFVDDCTNCTFILACQQLRVHNTKHCDFYLHVTSRAIIEDTTEVRFAPYNWKYENISQHFQLAGLDMNRNNWDLVDDFNWLASDKPSPNWHIMKEDEQNIEWA
ncbi:tubulin-specific chaperone C [Anabrus simplex]|uniref:tubulin-specific chaperone C n=1 Tax=Anabrus simplex TaxID=316456 RepID=UPI0035A29821